MSWQSYVDVQICSRVKCKFAVIASLDDGSIWAKFEKNQSFTVKQEELRAIAGGLRNNPETFHAGGIKVGSESYVCLTSEKNLLRGRKGTSPLIVVATNKCLIVVAGEDNFQPGQLNVTVENLGDYLRNSGY